MNNEVYKLLLTSLLFVNICCLAQPPGNGMIFNGISDYYTVSDNSTIDMSGSFTIEAWINPCDTSGHTMILTKLWCSGGRSSFYFSVFDGKLKWYWNANGSCGAPAINSYESNGRIIRNNIWQHVAVVHTPTSVALFYNGVLVAGGLVRGSYNGNLHNSNQPLRVGAYRWLGGSLGAFFNGRMDEIRFWNVALNSTQIFSRYNTALLGTESNLQLYHNFESISGAVISNSSTSTGVINNGNNSNGTVNAIANISNYPFGFDLGNDTTFCLPNSISVSIPLGYSRYSWTDGIITRNRVISNTGSYVGIGHKDYCFVKDTLSVTIIDCDSLPIDTVLPKEPCIEKFIMPNVFSPNGDGVNDFFEPIYYDCYSISILKIYNRWGQIVHESNSKIVWDGKTQNGNLVTEGTYFWVIEHSDTKGVDEIEKGFVTLFR